MAYQAIFKRCELKYLLTKSQKEILLEAMEPYMALDAYGHSLIRSLYFDTESYRLIRRSIERPAYKEKLRIRSYGRPDPAKPVFVELKKKYHSVVYKRRLAVAGEQEALAWLSGGEAPEDTQIAREIGYFQNYYQPLRPAVYLSYEREAFYPYDGSDLRITFDERIAARTQMLLLESEPWGTPLLKPDGVLMEIKTAGGIPLWLSNLLTAQKLYKSSFSRCGNAYQTMIYPQQKGCYKYA